ncbi:TonB-dependent receptor [Cellulophaga sp. HaHaR_3_176]|uniref:TonB-dependent receptor n=1 Tax=Cellulophaga sp. HaHaR_3_176 TaxID=1942464 RepID=UPI001C1F36F6|nr:TonB-dependent receptor [Cellulophaga sp. HaHaR_3_176]QWX83830.1 TonB-dependent receptor [Cellulophaga sp. HaHaR_3_176]
MKQSKTLLFSLLLITTGILNAQNNIIRGIVSNNKIPVSFANIVIEGTTIGTSSDENGEFELSNNVDGSYKLIISAIGYKTAYVTVKKANDNGNFIKINLIETSESLEEMVVTGTLKAVSRSESPVPVEVYSPTFLKQNPTSNIFEALQNVNGVRPQINCSVCNTGDIHINGLEGPYTLVLIDGMPIVSGLSTVYGLSGIPNSLIEQIEIIKGPASSLYGSEAVGGLINIITKNTLQAPKFSIDGFATSWGEYNLDAGGKINIGKKTDLLLGVNYFNFDNIIDNNGDNFTDLTLQNRISVFQKWNFQRNENRILSLAGRFFYEDRWGGELQWTPEFRGGNEIYGESIYTARYEVLGKYQLPVKEKMMFSFSYTDHDQNSVYGDTEYLAKQRIGFSQLTWDLTKNNHDILIGSALRYNYYDDNTTATAEDDGTNNPDKVIIPSLFVQDEISFSEKHSLLLGMRYDYDNRHGSIYTPRMAYRWKINDNDILRLNAGTGFRVVNLFTEEHAALTGARDVFIEEELDPEQSFNVNLNYLKKIYSDNGTYVNLDFSAFYTNFSNAIIPDYDTNPNLIIYDNLNGSAISQGISSNIDVVFNNGLKVLLGATLQDVTNTDEGIKKTQILTENFSATWNISYNISSIDLSIDYTGNIYGPMRLPLLSDLDPRSEYSPTWSIQNIQFTYKGLEKFEFYGGVKNLLNWTPNKGNPFLIARADDPFDENVTFDANGNAAVTPDNPYGLTFDPEYIYAPNQGIRAFAGLRYRID